MKNTRILDHLINYYSEWVYYQLLVKQRLKLKKDLQDGVEAHAYLIPADIDAAGWSILSIYPNACREDNSLDDDGDDEDVEIHCSVKD